jgi:hypothetical protein
VRLLLRDGSVPRWLRGLAAVGAAPIPGPVDELVLLVVAAILWLGYRDRLRAAWRDAA